MCSNIGLASLRLSSLCSILAGWLKIVPDLTVTGCWRAA